MIEKRLSLFSAFLIALFVANVTVFFTDVLALPLPRYFFGVSGSAFFGLIDALLLLPLAKRRGIPLIGWGCVASLAVLMIWCGLELFMGTMGAIPDFSLAVSFLPVLFAVFLVRLHCRLFQSGQELITAFAFVVVAMVLFHLFLVGLLAFDATLPMVNRAELVDKNALSLFLVLSLWLFVMLGGRGQRPAKFVLPALVGLALLHIGLNHARAAMLVLLMTLIVGCLKWFSTHFEKRWKGLLLASFAVVCAISLSFPLLQAMDSFHLLGHGDSLISAQSRSLTNMLLVQEIESNPWFGIGSLAAANVKAFGYMSHTLFLLVFASYGVVGSLLIPLLFFADGCVQRPINRGLMASFVLLVSLTAGFFNDPFPVYGLVLGLLSESGRYKNGKLQ